MLRRILSALAILVVVGILGGLIAYSQLIAEPNRVSGFIEADEIRVGSRVGGRVAEVLVQEGDEVTPGEVLVRLEPFDLRQREAAAVDNLAAKEADYQRLVAGYREEEIAQAKARHEQLEARLELLKAGPRQQEIDAAQARLDVAEAEKALALKEYDRRVELFENRSISKEEFDNATERLRAVQAAGVERERELDLLKAGTRKEEIAEAVAKVEEAKQAWQLMQNGYRKEEIAQAKAARDAAAADLSALREQIEELEIKSPVQGSVEALDLQKGDLVPAGAPVLSLLDERRKWIRAFVPQNRVGLQPGQKLNVVVDSFPDETFVGEITYIAREAEFTPNNVQTPDERAKQVFRVKVLLPKSATKLRPGMTAEVQLDPVEADSTKAGS